jgi:hypothetical protein
MPVNSLVELATNGVAAEQAALDEARGEMAAARERERAARAAVAAEVPQIAELEAEEVALRRRMAREPTAPDAAARAAELAELLAELRQRRALLGERQAAAGAAAADRRAAGRRAERAAARLALQEAALLQAARDRQRLEDEWVPALTSPPLSEIPQAVTDLLDELDGMDDQLEAQVPVELLDAVRERHAAARARREAAAGIRSAAEDAVDRLGKRAAGLDAGAAEEARRYDRVRERLLRFLHHAGVAIAAAEALVSAGVPELTQEQRDELADAGREADRQAAAALEVALREAEALEAERRVEREEAELRALRPPAYDPQPAVEAHEQALSALQDAEAEFDAAQRRVVFAWQAAAPEPLWRFVARLEEARARLEELRGTDPDQLDDLLLDADQKLARALEKAETRRQAWDRTGDRLALAELRDRALREGPSAPGA